MRVLGPFFKVVVLFSPAFPLRHYYIGGGELPPPTVPQVLHAGALASAELTASRHRPVCQVGRDKFPMDGGRGYAGECV